jgi:hypothetical protein
MITITIGGEQRRYEDASEQWINHQIQRRREDNVASCVTISIDQPPLNMVLRTPGCTTTGQGVGASRPPARRKNRSSTCGIVWA